MLDIVCFISAFCEGLIPVAFDDSGEQEVAKHNEVKIANTGP